MTCSLGWGGGILVDKCAVLTSVLPVSAQRQRVLVTSSSAKIWVFCVMVNGPLTLRFLVAFLLYFGFEKTDYVFFFAFCLLIPSSNLHTDTSIKSKLNR